MSLDSNSLMEELRMIEFRRSRLPDIREISTALNGRSRDVGLYPPPMTRLKRLEKGLAPMNWLNTSADLQGLVQRVEKVKPPAHSTFESICPARVPASARKEHRTRHRYQSLESHPEYMPPLKEFNYKLDKTVVYREALLRVSAISKLNRK